MMKSVVWPNWTSSRERKKKKKTVAYNAKGEAAGEDEVTADLLKNGRDNVL